MEESSLPDTRQRARLDEPSDSDEGPYRRRDDERYGCEMAVVKAGVKAVRIVGEIVGLVELIQWLPV